MFHRLVAPGALALAGILTPALPAQQACEKLAEMTLPHTTITSALAVPAGTVPAFGNAPSIPVPARCVVKAVARPTGDSEIKFEVWLPAAGWNGRYQQAGNGGWAGAIPVQSLAYAIRRGFAAAGTDDGHAGSGLDASWAIGHPEKLVDFGYRALHETTVSAKAVIRVFYGKDASRNYFVGCSDGGREALMEAQRFPEDFDGIIAGAPANDWSHLATGFVWNERALLQDASAIPPAKLAAIQKAVLAACDALDGVPDGLLEDPRACHFDPAALTCKEGNGPDCLTPPQAEALKKIYAGPRSPRTGRQIFPGYSPGTEAAWTPWIIADPPGKGLQFAFGNSYYGQAVFEDPRWDFRKLDFDADVALADEKTGSILNSTSPDLRSFRAHGGKLIQYHGWGDAAIAPVNSIEYYENVRATRSRISIACLWCREWRIAPAAPVPIILAIGGTGMAILSTTSSPRSSGGWKRALPRIGSSAREPLWAIPQRH